jgi:hypothetical protein
MAPHPPFVLDADGQDVVPPRNMAFNDGNAFPGTSDEYKNGYREQTKYVTSRLIPMVDHLEAISRLQGRDLVIIIHGDHGPRSHWNVDHAEKTDASESLPIFLAIRWSGTGSTPGVAVASLVNVYRELFRRYFNADLPVLPDRGFVSSFRNPYRFLEVDPGTVEPRR